ncbi:12472_t:CDS:2 [Cetraspora pellucida]|uniref:12472_t:CDS:1 n=1 Tax=Cetraspora pellucida TaxID=1433469 RepID=A0ACA9MJ29_9GLOM|nr:12472_t:CDS:2 [Cetraspora pellucida]
MALEPLIIDTHINANYFITSGKYENTNIIDNSEETRQEIVNIIINHAQVNLNIQTLYILEESEGYCKFILPLDMYKNWIKEEELSKKFNFIKPHRTYKNYASSFWSEHYVCSYAGTKRERNDCIEGGHTQKKQFTQKASKKVGCNCDLRICYAPNIFCNKVIIVHYKYKHNGHIPGSHNDVQFLKKSEETITKIKMFTQQGLLLSAIKNLIKTSDEVIESKLKENGWNDPKNVMLDNDDAEINAIFAIFPHSNIFLCWWHLKHSWRRWIQKNIEKKDHDNLFHNLEQLLSINNENKVDSVITQFEEKWKHTSASTQGNVVYIIEYYNDDFSCNCKAYFKHLAPCKHILAISRKYDIEIIEHTYLSSHKHLVMLRHEANLDDIPLNEIKGYRQTQRNM